MATNKQLKFFKGASAPAAPAAGMIWFCTSDRTIRVYTGTEWEKYSGLVNAEWVAADKKLNITSANGTVTTLDLSDCASASDITTKLTTINNTLTSHDSRITAAQNAADSAASAAAAADAKAVKEAEDRASEITRVEGLISAEATTARAAEQANAKAASDAAALGQQGIDDAASAAAAVETEKGRAEGVEQGLDNRLKLVEGAVGAGGSVESQIVAKIGDLDATVGSQEVADGKHVAVEVVETDGKLTSLTVVESDIASAQGLADEIARATAAEAGLDGRLDAAEGDIDTLQEQIKALEGVTHFYGTVADEAAKDAVTDMKEGDVIVVTGSGKEYIYDGSNWIELGNTTAEADRISALEGLVGSTAVSTQISNAIAELDSEKASSGEELVTVTVKEVDGKLESVVVDDAKLDTALSDLQGEVDAVEASAAANAAAIKTINETTVPGINSRLDGIDEALESLATSDVVNGINTRLETAEGEIDTLQAAITSLNEEQDEQDEAITAAQTQADKGVSDAAAALAEAQAKVKSVTGDADVNTSTTDHAVSLSLNKATEIASGNTQVVTSGAVYDALCWVEFN